MKRDSAVGNLLIEFNINFPEKLTSDNLNPSKLL